MDLDLVAGRHAIPGTPVRFVILLDTNALIWLERRHPRARNLAAHGRLYVSPASVLELQFLIEAGRLRLRTGGVTDLVARGPWLLDGPPASAWFDAALDLGWTRDPFDRLLVAHARVRRWRFATADTALLAHVPERLRLEI